MTLAWPSLEEVRAEQARRSLLRFTLYTKPDYLAGWFHKLLAAALDKFLDDVVNKRSPRLMIFTAPRHGKSELTSKRFPAYALGRHPDMQFIGTSWGADLASSVNRDVQRIIDSDTYGELFPGTTLWGKNIRTVADGSYLRNSDIFEIVNHKGQYKSAGRGGGLPGRGGDIVVMDDVVKDNEEANSPVIRAATWDWYTNDVYTRLMPGGGILFIMTRRHEDDIAGHLLSNMKKGGEQWEVISFPAVAEQDEEFRKKGEALHPERWPIEYLDKIKTGTSDEPGVGSRVWASLYQQRPSAAEGNIFKREDWAMVTPLKRLAEFNDVDRREYFRELGITRVIQRWDTALSEKKQSDYSACTTLGIARNRYYVINVWKAQLEFPDVLRQVQLLYDKWQPSKVFIEGGGSASGKATVQTLRRETRVPVFETITSTDKVLRANTISPHQEAKFVTLFQGEEWVTDFVDQCANFPNIKHDDDVDSWIGAMEEAVGNGKPMEISDDFMNALAGFRV